MDAVLAGLRAAAEPTRLRLLGLCARAELSVGELTRILGQSQPRVSRHLKLLCDAGLLERSREGSRAFYRATLKGPGAELLRALIGLIPDDDGTFALDLERLEAIKKANAEAAAAYFRENAWQWDSIRSLHVDEREVEQALLHLLPEKGVRDFLDIGTGTGRMLEIFAGRFERGIGVDLSREMLAVARANLERAHVSNCQLRHADMYRLPWPGGSFDAVCIHQVLHFAEAPAKAIAEAARVLRPGGRLLIVDFAPHDLDRLRSEHAHRRLGFADGEITEWCREAGLEPVEIVHLAGDPLTVTIWSAARRAQPALAATEKDSVVLPVAGAQS